jgi:flavorubredoxin
MAVQNIKPGIYYVGAIDWDRRLFDELIPLPDGTTYNAYVVQGSGKTALIDTVDPAKAQEFFNNLSALDIARIDYVITNHAEQDHSGLIPGVLERYPDAVVVTNAKCKTFTMEHLMVPEDKFHVVKDGDTLSLGDKTLSFIIAPWVHWPETMLTYLNEDRILFPCDLFGSHLASSDIFSVDEGHVYRAAKRYYAEIMMPFRTMIKKHLATLQKYEIAMIAPSHGPIHQRPEFIINAYREWVSDDVKNEVLLPYVSMHGSVHRMVAYFIEELMKRKIKVLPFNLTKTDIGELAMALVDAATIVIGSPTVLTGPHPSALYATYLANALRPKTRFASIIGSYGWTGKMPETLQSMLTNLKVEVLDPVIAHGHPKPDDFKALQRLADDILKKHRELQITT